MQEIAAKLSYTYTTHLDRSLADELIRFMHFVQNEILTVQLLQVLENNISKCLYCTMNVLNLACL